MDLEYEIILNLIVYALLVTGIVKWKGQQLRLPDDSAAAFGLLEVSLRRAFPDIKDGFTWREAISRVRYRNPTLNWHELENDLSSYELYRYGGGPVPPAPGAEFLVLLKVVRRIR